MTGSFNPSRETERLLKQAHAIGPWTGKLCAEIFGREGRVGQRKIYGVVNLARKVLASRNRGGESRCIRAASLLFPRWCAGSR